MKRPAESQLTKDTVDDDDDTMVQEPPTGIQMADPSVLSGRKVHNLPKRPLVPATPPATSTPLAIGSSNGTTTKSPESASRFSGFTGFGSSTPAFNFAVPVSQAKVNVPEASQTTTASSSQPAKGFSFPPLSNPTPPSTPPSTSDPQAKRDAAYKYYLSLRGLNISFLDAIGQTIQADPFVDVTEMLEKYKALRSSAQKEYDNSLSSPTSVAAVLSSKKSPSMPTPPKSFFAFGKGTGTDTTSQSHSTGFTPKPDYSQKEPPYSTKDGTSDNPPSFSTSQTLTVNNESASSGNQTSGLFPAPFGSSTLDSHSKHDTDSAESKMITPDKPGQGQDALQGKVTASSSFSFKPSAPTVPLTPGLSSFLNPSKPFDTGDSKSDPSNPSPPSSNPLGFGTGKFSGVSSQFSFGKGSIGNPVGFAFGSPSPAPHNDVKPSDTMETSPDSELKIPSDPDAALSQDPSPTPSQGSVYDADGPGEEDEVTLHEVKAQAYKMTLTGEKKTWVSAGRGQLKLKGRVDVKRRILMRNSTNGQVILNFNLFPGFKTNINGRMISFRVPGEDKSAAVYQLRLPNDAEVANLQKAIQREVDVLHPSNDT